LTQGIDYPNVKVVIQYGMCPDLCSLIQRVGRAARAPGTEALFIYMVESWATEEHIDRDSNDYANDPDTPVRIRSVGKGSKGKQWVGMASIVFATSTMCLRVEFIKYLGDKSGEHREDFH
jgi:superfamily II DNA helicase RecQ